MSVEITKAMVQQYSANVFHLSQQKGSRLRGMVRSESQNAEAAFYDRIGSVTAQKKTARHSDTTYFDTPHSRRRVTLEDYFYADLVDKEDKLRIIQSPESEYAQAAMWALGRAMDDVVIEGALGTAYSGKTGSTAVPLPDSQKFVATDGAAGTGTGLNIKTLREVKKKFHQNETGDSELMFAYGAEQLDDLLGENEITSSDYNTIRALVAGDVDTYMGFMFVRLERLPALSADVNFDQASGQVDSGGSETTNVGGFTYRRCFAWQREGVLLAISKDMSASIDKLPTKHFSTQVYASLGLGSTRLEDVKVVEVICKE